jgi:hypothetical protein
MVQKLNSKFRQKYKKLRGEGGLKEKKFDPEIFFAFDN